MASALRKPDILSFEGNCAENWRKFELDYDIYVEAAHPAADAKTRSYILLNLAGHEAIERARTFEYGAEESKENPAHLKAKFKALCEPKKNITVLRHKFNTRMQKKDEDFQSFLVDLRNKADVCDFGGKKDEFIRDRIVVGVSSETVRKTLFKEPDLTLDKAIELCQYHELAETETKAVNQDPDVSVVNTKKAGKTGEGAKQKQPSCRWCGTFHPPKSCPAYGKQCGACGMLNHFAKVCQASKRPVQQQQYRPPMRGRPFQRPPYRGRGRGQYRRQLHEIDYGVSNETSSQYGSDTFEYYEEPIEQFNDFVIEAVNVNTQCYKDEIHVTAFVENSVLELKIDSGAKCNVISKDTVKNLRLCQAPRLNTAKRVKLITYSKDEIETLGTCMLSCNVAGQLSQIEFQVVDRQAKTILGLPTALKLDLLALHPEVHEITQAQPGNKPDNIPADIWSNYADLFSNKPGCLPVTYKMKLNPDIQPVVRPPRRVPLAMSDKIKESLDNMEKDGIIMKVTEPTEWVSSMVAAKKKNTEELRICIDPRDLNQALMRPHHPLKTLDEVASNIPGAKVFSILDAKSAFWHIKLDEKSSLYTTFSTVFGRYRYLRMPYGITSGSEVYQDAIEKLMKGTPCKVIVDDILVSGIDTEDHDRKLKIVMDRIREINLKLNVNKCKFRLTSIKYVGNKFTSEGLLPDDEKIKAITEMQPPKSVTELQRFLGMVNYLSRYIQNYSDKTAPLRELLHNDVAWIWDERYAQAFENLKKELTNPPVLAYYDVRKPVTLTCDASKTGLGASILQEDRPIAYASRALTPNEEKWAQIEKEMAAIVFGCTKFHDYVYGKRITVETDHKPLESIFKKPISKAPARLQNMLLKLQKYDLNIVFKKGTQMFLADTLSRSYLQAEAEPGENLDYEVMQINPPTSTTKTEELISATKNDEVLSKLSSIIIQGTWPTKFSSTPTWMQPYFPFRDELLVDNDIVMRGTKIIVPSSLREEYMKQLHKNHMGADSTTKLAKDYFYWPKMDEEIHYFVDQCSACNSTKPKNQKEPLQLHPIPTLPWQTVSTDLFEWNSIVYLILVDSYSGWFEFNTLKDMTSKSVINLLKRHFATHGCPQVVLSDNARYFTSEEFRKFAQEWNFEHVTSSPKYPQSNFSERAVQQAKNLLTRAQKDNSDVYMGLLMLRNTPVDNHLKSPAERLFSRRTNIPLPTTQTTLQPHIISGVPQNLYRRRMQKKSYYDKSARPLSSLIPNQNVRIQTDKGFEKQGIVLGPSVTPRSYVVQSGNTEYRRNRRHLLPVAENCRPRVEQKVPQTLFVPSVNQGVNQSERVEPKAPPKIVKKVTVCRPEPAQKIISVPKLVSVRGEKEVITKSGRISKPNPRYKD